MLDPAETAWLRDEAGYAVSEIGTDQDRDRLRPLLNSTKDEDPEDQLKGIALRALWPHRLAPLEMLELLTPRQAPNLLGSYGGFLYGIKDMKRLADAELPQALVWAKDVGGGLGVGSDVSNIAGMVAYEAWERMDRPGVLDPFADLAVDRMLHHWTLMTVPDPGKKGGWSSEYEQACTEVIRGDDQRRRTLIKACLQRIGPEKAHHFINPGMGGALAFGSDFEWAVEQCLQSEGDLSERFAELAKSLRMYAGVGPWKNTKHLDLWLEARDKSEAIQKHMGWPVVVELGSDLEKEMKRQWQREKGWELRAERQRRVREGRRVQPLELLKDASRRARDEDLRWMPRVIEALQLNENGQWTFTEDLTESYAWKNADEDTKQLALSVCLRYLVEMPVPARVGAEEGKALLSAWAAFALVLLSSESPEVLEAGLADERIREVAPHLVEGMNRSGPNGEKSSRAWAFLWRKCPAAVTQGILAVLVSKADHEHLPSIFDSFPKPIPESLGTALFDAAKSQLASDKVTPDVIEFLIARDVPGAFEYAVQCAGEPGESDPDWVRRRRWLSAMARDKPGRVWPEFKSMAPQGDRWARERLWAAVNSRRFHDDRAAFQDGLSDEQLVELSKVLFEVFDPEGDRGRSRAGRISDEDEVRRWRGQVLNTMVARGTAETVQGLRDLSRSYPQHDWLKHYVLSGTVQKRRYAWVPAQVTQLVEMENDASRRLVRSGSELLTVVLESLRAWEIHTRKHDLVRSLWDEQGKNDWHPKDEEHLSQTLAAWLEQDSRLSV